MAHRPDGGATRWRSLTGSTPRPPTWRGPTRSAGTTRWALGEAFAWAEHELPIPAVLVPVVSELIGRRVPSDLPCQLVHGDLCGNILFDARLPPAVIDISPFWRPKRYADAILVIDAMAWHRAGEEALDTFADPIGVQMLVRALLFRLAAASVIFAGHDGRLIQELRAYEPVLRLSTSAERRARLECGQTVDSTGSD